MNNEKLGTANWLADTLEQLQSDLSYLESEHAYGRYITLHGVRFSLDKDSHEKVKKICLDFLNEKRKKTQEEFDNI